ncbi:uncharacterized protein LTR77_004523 [Saxophila tyrrhenica]|uniref:Uncharacterized protein n=1 Tax=Saxophila tyrrhenica TaxID=1690608 RepID=A0AAV9PCY5_9PEZI|nr:hypothetical protein LTR77_004523 [Saxophila tyrrhenica]
MYSSPYLAKHIGMTDLLAHRNNQQTLPPIRGYVLCSGSGCNSVAVHHDAATRKAYCANCVRRNSTVPTGPSTNLHQAYNMSEMQRNLGFAHQEPAANSPVSDFTDHEMDSAASCSTISSPANTPILTPRSLSAASRSSRSHGRRAQSTSGGYCNKCGHDRCRIEKHRALRKKDKERANRNHLQEVAQQFENILSTFGSGSILRGNKQSSGNATTSGLQFKKIDVMKLVAALLCGLLQQGSEAAIRTGTEAEFQANLHEIIDKYRDSESDDPTAGTFLENRGHKCRNDENGDDKKRCVVHGHASWAECRSTQAQRVFQRNVQAFRASL